MTTMTRLSLQPQIDQQLLDEIHRACEVMRQPASPVLRTRLYRDDLLSKQYAADVWLASELHQPIGAYKIRGAYNFVCGLTPAERRKGVVTASAGNHGLGVALSARRAGVKSHVFMPACTPQNKLDRVALLGGAETTITLAGETFDESQALARRYCERAGAVFAPPFNHRTVIAGQGTWGVEVSEALPDVDMVFCPVGGMGLLAGISTAIKSKAPDAEIIGVEPDGAASMRFALERGGPTPLTAAIDPFVDGAAVREVGSIPFKLAHQLVSDVVTVCNAELRQTTTELWERERPIRAELAGALAIAGLHTYQQPVNGKTVVCMVSGGNLSRARYEKEVRL